MVIILPQWPTNVGAELVKLIKKERKDANSK